MKEIWKDIIGYEGLYQVSNFGNVFSLKTNKQLKQNSNNYGYKYVILCRNGQRKYCTVHRLVANAFIPNLDNLPIVNHKDENVTNNFVDNLEWCTFSYNNTYNGVHYKRVKNKTKHLYRYDKNGNIIEEYDSVNDVKRILGASTGDICECCSGKLATYLGSVWSYDLLTVENVQKRFAKSQTSRKNNSLSKAVDQYDLNGNFICHYPSAREAGRQLGFSASLIAGVCRGEHEYTHGYIFRYS